MSVENKQNPVLSWLHKNKFYSSTKIDGFNFVDKSKSRLEVATWYIVLIIFTVFTGINVYRLVDEYLENQMTTHMKIMKNSDTFPKISEITVNYHLPHIIFFARFIKNFTSNIDEQRNFVQSFPFVWERNSDICKSLRNHTSSLLEINSKESFLDVENLAVLDPLLVYAIITLISGGDSVCGIVNDEMSTKLEDLLARNNFSHTEIGDITKTAISPFYNFIFRAHDSAYRDRNETYFEQKFYMILPASYDYTSYYVYSPTYFYHFPLTFKLPVDSLRFGLQVYPQTLDDNMDQVVTEKLLSYSEPLISVSHVDKSVQVVANFGEKVNAHVRVTGLFKFHRDRCHKLSTNDKSVLQCINRCMVVFIQQRCQCNLLTPGINIDVNVSLPTCLLHHDYFRLLEGVRHNCSSLCSIEHDRCESTFYQPIIVKEKFSRNYSKENAVSTDIFYQLTTKPYVYPLFTEQPAQPFDSFMGELGGVFDFWLGVSVIAIVHMVLYVTKQIRNVFKKETKTSYTVRAMMGRFEPTVAIVPASVDVSNAATEENFKDLVESAQKEKNLEKLCSILGAVIDQMNDLLA